MKFTVSTKPSRTRAFLPQVEDGTLILIGATTENPFFEVNKALISRSTVFQLHAAAAGSGDHSPARPGRRRPRSGRAANGRHPRSHPPDCGLRQRRCPLGLNALESAADHRAVSVDERIAIDAASVPLTACSSGSTRFDRTGVTRYHFRPDQPCGSDLMRLFSICARPGGGVDIEFHRRVATCAAEDVGMANPNALLVAAAYQGAAAVGMPERFRILLSEAVVLVATSPKSNAYTAIDAALADVRER